MELEINLNKPYDNNVCAICLTGRYSIVVILSVRYIINFELFLLTAF
ncbi:hypothetical protein NEIMUCOT_06200 [Neisseria mucosa ATCC 25996]|uniref:Uncharacterized protein n=1 Tax=Neisseria mucosa (strain ATCC 25996 / DSM 4631 / NCTC 10774 / M26) TaxID=546266 RepID=D2ZZW6_NEIM2|nr:hypothetical protein NEIMUCOT_06200 [Neisseria mucosa ATCC 25996]